MRHWHHGDDRDGHRPGDLPVHEVFDERDAVVAPVVTYWGNRSPRSTPKNSEVAEEEEERFEVTGQQCTDNGVCTYTYSIQPNYVGYHPLPEQDFTVFYEISGGQRAAAARQFTITVNNGQARVSEDVTVEGPPGEGARWQATVTQISLVAGPKPVPPPEMVSPELSPQPIN